MEAAAFCCYQGFWRQMISCNMSTISLKLSVDGLIGVVKLFSNPYFWLPRRAIRVGTRASFATPLATKNFSTHSMYAVQSSWSASKTNTERKNVAILVVSVVTLKCILLYLRMRIYHPLCRNIVSLYVLPLIVCSTSFDLNVRNGCHIGFRLLYVMCTSAVQI